jgi:hypothetical protein
MLVDDRLDLLALPESAEYRERLLAGHGFDEDHRALLERLQVGQRRHRNRPDGYWIASADADAAMHARITRIHAADVDWAILATDGVIDPANHLDQNRWSEISSYSSSELESFLQQLRQWETSLDPKGQQLPRAKQSDDKAVVALQLQH